MWSISKLKRNGRLIIFFLLLISIFGPWAFDAIYMPPGEPCSVRLTDHTCGLAMPGIWLLAAVFGFLVTSIADLVKGVTANEYDGVRGFFQSLLFLSLVLPFLSTLLVARRGDHRPRLVFHLIACSAAFIVTIIVGLMMGIFEHSDWIWRLWGIWLYMVSLASALILEIIVLAANSRHRQAG
jgi:hypothetical protein